jgi:hypothetical protein
MKTDKAFAIVSSLVVVAALIGGLYVGGSPGEQRLLRFDERRVNDLRALSHAISKRWDKTKRLPQMLDELVDGQGLRGIPADPETESSYVYEVLSINKFRLCADFSRPSLNPDPKDFWIHKSGKQCFEFTLVTHDA